MKTKIIRGALHELRNTIYSLHNLCSDDPENTETLKKLSDKSNEMLLFMKSELDMDAKARLFLSKFAEEVSDIDLMCKELAASLGQKAFSEVGETLNDLTKELQLIIGEGGE